MTYKRRLKFTGYGINLKYKKRLAVLIIGGCILLACLDPVFSGVPEKISIRYDKGLLEQGCLQVFTYKYESEKGGEGKRVVGIMLINAPPERVWQVLEDWDEIGKHMPSLEYYRTKHVVEPVTSGEKRVSYIEGKLKIAFLKIFYTVRVTFDENEFRQEWRLVGVDEIDRLKQRDILLTPSHTLLEDIRGFEYIEPYGGGSQTVYYYAPIVEVSMPIPAWIERRLSESCLNEYMEGVKRKAEENN